MEGNNNAISLATQLGENQVVKLLNESLKEEQAAETKLRTIAQTIIKTAPKAEETPKAKSANA
jgi:ferritin-like metal-binding protein YciE